MGAFRAGGDLAWSDDSSPSGLDQHCGRVDEMVARTASAAESSPILRAIGLWRIWTRLGFRDIKRRFQRTSLGIGWILINLTVTVLAIGLVYGKLFQQDASRFLPYLTAGIVLWGYLTTSIVEGGNALISSEGYIKQISLPYFVYILRTYVSATTTTLMSLVAFLAVVLVYQVPLGLGALWALPGFLLVATVSLLLMTVFAQLNARFRDFSHMAALGMQVLFYITPVIWPAEALLQRGDASWIIEFNPLYHLLEVARHPLIHSAAARPVDYLVVSLLILALFLLAAIVTRVHLRNLVYLL